MEAGQLWRQGRVGEAAASAASALRDDPANPRLRTLYFELLCFRGDWARARTQLRILGAEPGHQQAARYFERVVEAETQRQQQFQSGEMTGAQAAAPRPGSIDGVAYEAVADGDARVGARLELITATGYLLVPFAEIGRVVFEPPRRLRDLLWRRARVTLAAARGSLDLGDALVPALAPLSFLHADEAVQCGRVTVSDGGVQAGQKMLDADTLEAPLLAIRELRFAS